jgi:hypothetical protein
MFEGEGGEFPRKPVAPLDGAHIPVSSVDVSLYNTMELLTLRNKIDARLPPMSMAELNLEEEVVRQFMTVKALQATTLEGNEEGNKKAAVVNACAAALQQLAKLQIEIHTAERFKKIENLLIKHLKLLPKEAAEAFLSAYAELILEPNS